MILESSTTVIEAIVARLLNIKGPIVIMAGHFSLVEDRGGDLIPAIADDIEDEELRRLVTRHQYMGDFPKETWRVGIQILQRLQEMGRAAKLLILVNDWQHVPAAESGKRNLSRDNFFSKAVLPPSLKKMLSETGLDESVFITDARDGKACPFWAESKLRARYNRHLKVEVPVDSPCAQEWVPLLVRLEELGVAGFVSFVPGVCKMPIIRGTERADECLQLSLRSTMVFPGGDRSDFWASTWLE